MKKKYPILGVIICLFSLSVSIQAMDLLTAYHIALQNDPTFKRALAQYLEDKEATAESRAALLPQIFFTGSISAQRLYQNNNARTFGTHAVNVTLSQTIFDATAFQRLAAAHASVKQAAYVLAAAQQDLILRVALAYFQVLQAEDVLHFTELQRKANKNQIDIILDRMKYGHATITSYDQAKAQYDSISARFVQEQIDLINRKQQLRRILGIPYGKLAKLQDNIPLHAPIPEDLAHWVQAAKQQNLELLANRYAVITARIAIKAEQANHLPIVTVSGEYNDFRDPFVTEANQGFNPRERNLIGSVNVDFPVLQGGLILSRTRAAIARYQQSIATMMEVYQQVLADTRNAYHGIVLGIKELQASKQAVLSHQDAYRHTLESYKAGMETTIDLLLQQNQLFDAEREYATNRYRYLLNLLRLQQGVGTLQPYNLMILNQWLISNGSKPKKTNYKNYKKTKKRPHQHPHKKQQHSQEHKIKLSTQGFVYISHS